MVDGDGDPRNVGCRVILPSSFTGGPRYMHERQQDAMTYVRKYGHPDLFITMTTNPNWPEIRNNLLPGQEPLDRPDLVACVFRLKVKKLLEMLTKEMIFGKPRAWLYSTEWQKGMIIQWEASGTRGNIVDACLKRSHLWDSVVVKQLHTNMRVHLCGKFPIDTLPDVVQLPDTMGTFVDSKEELVSRVYPDLLSNFRDLAWLSERCILAPLNKTTHSINMTLVEQLPGDCCDYRSLDTIPDESQAVHFPTEFLNSLEVSGLPQHLLLLKVGAPIIILRSLDPPRVTNGTRCVVTKLLANTVEAKISHAVILLLQVKQSAGVTDIVAASDAVMSFCDHGQSQLI
ncbi:uncharacterized protein [Dysidea avara]|uniref:uncharacterized protein n=1 Tax=Dysidea avara TaxID=196820 RepID=UPI0033205555